MAKGIVSRKEEDEINEGTKINPENQDEAPVKERKLDFEDVHVQDKLKKARLQKKMDEAAKTNSPEMDGVERLNKSLSGQNDPNNVQEELEDDITEEDMALAEELLFKGYAQFDKKIPVGKDNFATLCSTTAEESQLINELTFDYIKEHESEDGKSSDLPENNVNLMIQFFNIALAFKGYNGGDICEKKIYQIDLIKSAIKKLRSLEDSGNIKGYEEMRGQIKNSIKGRASKIRTIPIAVIDFLSNQKFQFDRKMYEIMNRDNIVPKF